MKFSLILALFVSLSACSNVKMIKPERKVAEKIDTTKLYKQSFMRKMNEIKEKIRIGKSDNALADLAVMKEEGFTAPEKATRRNLMGVITFTKKNFDLASKHFEDALPLSKEDPALESQIYLNLGSAYYKLNQNEKALATISLADFHNLTDGEAKNIISYTLAFLSN